MGIFLSHLQIRDQHVCNRILVLFTWYDGYINNSSITPRVYQETRNLCNRVHEVSLKYKLHVASTIWLRFYNYLVTFRCGCLLILSCSSNQLIQFLVVLFSPILRNRESWKNKFLKLN